MKKCFFWRVFTLTIQPLLLFHFSLFPQGWEKVYTNVLPNDNFNDGASNQKMVQTSDGGYLLLGDAAGSIALIKTNSSGDIIWAKKLTGPNFLETYTMIDSDAGYLIGGKGLNSSFLLKVSPMGNFVWAHSFPEAAAIETMMKNGQSTVIAGKKTGTSAGVYVARVNNIDGNIIWGKTISGQVMVPKDVAPAGNNAFVLLAEKPGITYGIGDECYLIKFDEEGTLLWKKSFANGKDLSPQCMQLTSDSGYIIGGTMLMKLDSEGTIQWLRQWYYGNQIRDIFQTDNSGFVAACGDAWSNYSNISAYKFSPSGTIEWKSVLGNEEDFPQTILQTADKGIVIGGGRGSYGLYLLKTDSLGQSGCNTDFGTIPYYQDNFSFCVVNEPSITIAASNDAENLSSFDVISFPVNAMDPCCNATAEIDGSYYPCAGDSFYFYGYGSTHLLWSNGDTTRNIITTDTIVFLTVTNTCGSFTDSMIIHPAFTPTFTYSVSKDTICRSDSVMLAFYGNAPVYYCYANSGNYNDITKVNDSLFVLRPVTTTTFTLIGYTDYYYENCGSEQTITIYVLPEKPSIHRNDDTLYSSSPFNNQWHVNGSPVVTAINKACPLTVPGFYYVEVADGGGCINYSDSFSFVPDTTLYTKNAWHKVILSNNNGSGSGTCLLQTEEGDIIIGGNYSNTTGDIAIIKTTRNGDITWSKTYGGNSYEAISSMIKVDDGFVITGFTYSFGNGNRDVYLAKLDEQGNLLWSKAYGDWNNQVGNSVIQTSDGGYFICGSTTNPNTFWVNDGYVYANNDMYLLKTDSLGNLSWAKNYFSSGNEEGTRGLETADGGFLAVGNNYDLDVGDRIFLLKTDHQGNIHWSRKIETLSYSVRVTAENAPGQRFLINASSYAKGCLMMFDDAGEAVWSKKIEYPNSAWSSNLYITNDNAIVCMTYAFFGKHVLAKIDWTGNPIWSRAINIQGYSTNATLMQLQDGTFLISGSENTIGYYGSDQISLINTDEYGETNCSDTANPVVSDVSVNFLNHSTSVGSLGREIDFNFNEYPNLFQTLTICHSAEEISIVQEMPQQSFIKIFPNPGRGVFNLETRLPEIDYQINIYDFTGRCIVQQKVRRSKCTIDLGWASKGVYFLEFVSNEMREVKKIVLN